MFLPTLPVYAQSTGSDPWDNAVNVLKTAFTGTIVLSRDAAIAIACRSCTMTDLPFNHLAATPNPVAEIEQRHSLGLWCK
jgi:hypothetical protein